MEKIIRMNDKEYKLVKEPAYYPAYQRSMMMIERAGKNVMVPTPMRYEIIKIKIKDL